jgi:hypothetical protein
MPTSYAAAIQNRLWPRGSDAYTWAIVDGARDRRIYTNLLNSYANYTCLYAGPLAPELEIAAPYLVQLDHTDRFTQQLLDEGWGNSWGVFLRCDASIEKLRRHLRGFLVVQDAAGKKLVFRYYDPRVLRVYLPTCLPDELKTVFGPIDHFMMEGDSPDTIIDFTFERNRLNEQKYPLAASAARR